MSFDPISFLANVERIFSAATGLSDVKTWTRPTKLSTSFETPEVAIEMIAGSMDSISLSYPNRQIEFYVRFVIFEEQTSSASKIGDNLLRDHRYGEKQSRPKNKIGVRNLRLFWNILWQKYQL